MIASPSVRLVVLPQRLTFVGSGSLGRESIEHRLPFPSPRKMHMNTNFKRTLKIAPLAAVLSLVLMGASDCDGGEEAPSADSDSSQSYKEGSKIPVDKEVYQITGEVVGPVNDLTRQVEPAKGETSGYIYGNYGSISGSFTGPIEAGKGFVRLLVQSSEPSTDLAPTGDVTIIKTSDTKVKALLPGDVVEFKCRRQYENIAAVVENQEFDPDDVAAWELDYCRLASPVITVR